MKDIMPGDLVEHMNVDHAVGLVLKVWYEEEPIAEVLWTNTDKPKPTEWRDVQSHRAVYLKVVRSNRENIPEL
tara:strand:- start:28 stop:246 length:219 start_codon:yes stop_codon:yes gene_type:complete